jgi:hypothetical protein
MAPRVVILLTDDLGGAEIPVGKGETVTTAKPITNGHQLHHAAGRHRLRWRSGGWRE